VLIIRAEQMAALQSTQRQQLEDRVVAHLRRRFPARCAARDEDALRAEAVCGIASARAHGVTTVESIAFLCGWFLELGDEFERSPGGDEALAILRDPTYPGQIKVLLIGEILHHHSRGRRLVGF